jgi:hypothetical protein
MLLATIVAIVQQIVRRLTQSNTAGGGLPPVVGDTWPPVPTNPDRGD